MVHKVQTASGKRPGVVDTFMTGQEALAFDAYRLSLVEIGIPRSAPKIKIARYLRSINKWGFIKGKIASAGSVAREDWELTNTVRRSDDIVTAFGMTKAELDTMFTEARKL
jgi:hypothetical protein